RLLFGGGPDVHTAFKELRVFDHEPYPDCGRTGKKDGDKNPRFPIIKRPCGEKEQRSHDDRKQKKLYCDFEVEVFVHDLNLVIQRREYFTHSLQAWVEMKGAVFRNHTYRSVVESPRYEWTCSTGRMNR